VPVETRYPSYLEAPWNGVTDHLLRTVIRTTAPSEGWTAWDYGTWICYWGIRVFIAENGTKITELTPATEVAIVSRSVDGEGHQSATWDCPETPMARNQRVRVEIRGWVGGGSYTRAYTTEKLGASKLDATTWTVIYWTRRAYDPKTDTTLADFKADLAGYYESRIENFSWTPAPVVWGGSALPQLKMAKAILGLQIMTQTCGVAVSSGLLRLRLRRSLNPRRGSISGL